MQPRPGAPCAVPPYRRQNGAARPARAPAAPRERSLAVGLGFRRGVTVDQLEAAIRSCLAPNTMADVASVATLETKAGEPALAAFCERHGIPLVTFSAADIQACFSRNPSLQASPHVQAHLGVGGVCEPCALLAAEDGRLIRDKRALDGVTVAIAVSGAPDKQDRSRTS